MIHLEDQVVSLKLAMEMRDTGFPQDSYFSHLKTIYGDRVGRYVGVSSSTCPCAAAYTVAELGQWLPDSIRLEDVGSGLPLSIKKYEGLWEVWYGWHYSVYRTVNAKKLTDACAKMLLWLAGNGHIHPKELP